MIMKMFYFSKKPEDFPLEKEYPMNIADIFFIMTFSQFRLLTT